jgi:hypothetical protein
MAGQRVSAVTPRPHTRSMSDLFGQRPPEVPVPTDAQRAAHEARVRDTQEGWGPVRRRMAQVSEYVPEFLGGALWGDPTDPEASRANLLGQMLTASVPFASGVKRAVSRVVRPIRAYHGSPHDFPAESGAPLGQFRSESIGTGEGAQAYGRGLYFAEREATAASYKPPSSVLGYQVGEKFHVLPPVDSAKSRALRELADTGDPDRLLLTMRHRAEEGTLGTNFKGDPAVLGYSKKYWSNVADEVQRYKDQPVRRIFDKTGRTYEVDIHADPEGFLDWDAPVSQQSPRVQEALNNLWTKKGGTLEGRTRPPFTAHEGSTGESVHAAIATSYGPTSGDDAALVRAASEALQGEGITGIRYLDQGSRAAGQGTRNYVVFPGNERLIEIKRKYTWLLPFMGAGAFETWAQKKASTSGED